MEAFVKVDRVTLSVPVFRQRERQASGWASMFLGALFDPPKRETTRLLDEISFEAREGDRVAILGRNGAGKSTLLRVLNGVYAPTSGSVRVEGSCQALLNMSLGFNGEATVRENIFLRGTAMGLKAADLRAQIEPILDFSGLHEKANYRLRTLSAGQRMRLGFAISTSFQHDIILMDEWVGTGDSEFMAKATERMRDRVGGSKVVMLASHSVGLLRSVCNKGIVLEQGRLVYAGEIVPALKAYHDMLEVLRAQPGFVPEKHDQGAADAIHGYVEDIEIDGGVVHLRGWCVSSDGRVPTGLVMEADGLRHAAEHFERYERPDVAEHLGLSNNLCGFRARIAHPRIQSLADLGEDLKVYSGHVAEQAYTPLPIASRVAAMLEMAARTPTPAVSHLG
jgi:ABC-type polysaccharide/polyol phosphate transport system ATPase subunit